VHEISIPESVVQAVQRQRGKLYRYDGIVGSKTALVVIDLQNVFMLPGMPIEVPAAREIVPNVNRLAESVREAGGKVVWVQMTLEGEQENWSVFFDGDPRGDSLAQLTPGAHGHALHDDLDVQPEDEVIRKKRYSAFIQGSSNLDEVLRAAGIDTIVVVGTLTNVCCESSARDAMMLNYKVLFVSDANAALTDADHNATLGTILRVFGDVRTTDEVANFLAESREPAAR
jgi:ureidoacrylate peracid hydrolase